LNALSSPSFRVETFDRLVYFQVRGTWTLAADLQWLTQTSEAMNKMRGSPWYLLADMRGWVLPKEVAFSSKRAKYNVDRRNEIAECWWVNEDDDLNLLLPVKEKLPITVNIVTEASEVNNWLEQYVNITPEILALLED
jgi:hypothetical protein